MTPQASVPDERRFLHDLSTPISTAMIAIDALAEDFRQRKGKPADPGEFLALAEHARAALERANQLMLERRTFLGGGRA